MLPSGGPNRYWFLKRINIFAQLSEPDMAAIERHVAHQQFKPREVIYFPEDEGDQVYFLKEGRVKITQMNEGGRKLTLTMLEPGEVFGEMALVEPSARENYAEALDQVWVCRIAREDFENPLKEIPHLALEITKLIGFRRRQLEMRLVDMVFKGVPQRLAALLVNLAGDEPQRADQGIPVPFKLTHQEMANLVGSTRETVTTTLHHFREEGFIDLIKRRVIILDMPGLKESAASPVRARVGAEQT